MIETPLMVTVPADSFTLITSAAAMAATAHAGQVRKELNEPYIIHPARVAKMAAQLGYDPHVIAAAYLHDVVEDTNIPMTTLEAAFPEPTIVLVRAMTKWWGESHPSNVLAANKAAYYDRILFTPQAPDLKVMDRIDNLYDFERMARLSPGAHRWAKNYHRKTTSEFPRILEKVGNRLVIKQFEVALAALENAL